MKLAALAVIVTFYGFARLPAPSAEERAHLAAGFAFTRLELPQPADLPRHSVREVHPSLAHIAAWISSVGASLALTDLDGDGLANDVCYVDNGSNRVVVTPAPGTGERFALFTLDPHPLPWNETTMAPMGCLPGDLDEDGTTDLLVYYWGRTPVAFLQRSGGDNAGEAAPAADLGAGRFRPLEVVPYRQRWFTNAATRADVDGDGHVDLIVGNYFQDDARILDPEASGSESMQDSMSRAANAGRNRLLLWAGGRGGAEPEVRFREAEGAFEGRSEVGWTLALGAADLDGDLLPEIYVGNDFGPDQLLHNRSRPGAPRLVPVDGRRGFTTPRSKVLGHDSFKGMGVDFADVNGDGWLDLWVSNIADEFALEESHFLWVSTGDAGQLARGRAPYVDESEALGLSRSGWGWDTRWGDFDADGVPEGVQATGFVKGTTNRWPELHEVAMGNDLLLHRPSAWHRFEPGDDLSGRNPNPFFVRAASGRWVDLAADLGLAEPMVTRAVATADVDGDGDLDFAVGNQWERSYLYRNDGRGRGRPLLLDLRLPVEGGVATPAIGAAAVVRLPDGRRLVAQVDGGNGHSGARSPELHFGLGAVGERQAVPVEITWRDRRGSVHRESRLLPPGRHTWVLGEAEEIEPGGRPGSGGEAAR